MTKIIDLGFWIILMCLVIVTVMSAIAFVRWNKALDDDERTLEMLREVAVFLDEIRRELGITVDDPDKPEVTE